MGDHSSVLRLRAQVESLKHELQRENELRLHAERLGDYWFRQFQKYGRHLDDCAEMTAHMGCTCGFVTYTVTAGASA